MYVRMYVYMYLYMYVYLVRRQRALAAYPSTVCMHAYMHVRCLAKAGLNVKTLFRQLAHPI